MCCKTMQLVMLDLLESVIFVVSVQELKFLEVGGVRILDKQRPNNDGPSANRQTTIAIVPSGQV